MPTTTSINLVHFDLSKIQSDIFEGMESQRIETKSTLISKFKNWRSTITKKKIIADLGQQ